MATVTGNLLRAVLCGTVFTEQFCNVWFFVVDALTGTELNLTTLAGSLEDEIIENLLDFQTDDVVWNKITVDNLSNGVDFVEVAINRPGTIVGSEPLSSFNAFQVKMSRGSKITRNGYKRFPGIAEISVEGQQTTAAFQAALANAIAGWDEITVPGVDGGTVSTIIMGRTLSGQPDLLRWQRPAQIVGLPDVTTQNTRKKGRGA